MSIAMGSLFQCPNHPLMKNLYLISSLNLLFHSFIPFPPVLSLITREKRSVLVPPLSLWGNHRPRWGLCSWLMPHHLLPPHTPIRLTLTQSNVPWWYEVTFTISRASSRAQAYSNNPFNITSLWKFSRINYVRNENIINYWKYRVRDIFWIRPKFSETSFYRTNIFDVTGPQAYRKVHGPVVTARNGIFHVSAACSSYWCWIKNFLS